jgi:rubredoxin
MTALPAICRHCGLTFLAARAIENAARPGQKPFEVIARDSWYGCPRCGQLAQIVDGKYQFSPTEIRVLESWSPERLDQIEELLRRLQREKASPKQVAEAILKDAPEAKAIQRVAEFLEVVNQPGDEANLAPSEALLGLSATVLALLLWLVLAYKRFIAGRKTGRRSQPTSIELRHARKRRQRKKRRR